MAVRYLVTEGSERLLTETGAGVIVLEDSTPDVPESSPDGVAHSIVARIGLESRPKIRSSSQVSAVVGRRPLVVRLVVRIKPESRPVIGVTSAD